MHDSMADVSSCCVCLWTSKRRSLDGLCTSSNLVHVDPFFRDFGASLIFCLTLSYRTVISALPSFELGDSCNNLTLVKSWGFGPFHNAMAKPPNSLRVPSL